MIEITMVSTLKGIDRLPNILYVDNNTTDIMIGDYMVYNMLMDKRIVLLNRHNKRFRRVIKAMELEHLFKVYR